MWEDPIAEVHRIREEIAAKFNFDVKAMFADRRKRQQALGSRLVTRKRADQPGEADRSRASDNPAEPESKPASAA